MKLRALRTRGWRNLQPLVFVPGPSANVIAGANGQGKTNVIEAIHTLVNFRSFRSTSVDELIGRGQPRAWIEAQVTTTGLDRTLAADLGRESKVFTVDGKSVRRDADSLRGVGVVLFVPEDLLLPRASPAARRRFLDTAIFGRHRTYYKEALAYARVLKSRNAVLKTGGPAALLDAYDEQLAQAGARIVVQRRLQTAALAPRFVRLFESIHDHLAPTLAYRSHDSVMVSADSESALAATLAEGLTARRSLDLKRRYTGFGPHTDDLDIGLAGHPAREHASQGQLRSLVLALKLAERELLEEALGEPPLLLLDDVASELDSERRRRLFEVIAGLAGQTFITVTERDLLPGLEGRTDFNVQTGVVQPA